MAAKRFEHVRQLLSQTHTWGDDLELRERLIAPHLSEDERSEISSVREHIRMKLPALYQKYGPWLVVYDMTDDDSAILRVEAQKQKRDWKAGHKARCKEQQRNTSRYEEQAMTSPTELLIFKSIRDFYLLADSEIKRAVYSATGALSSSPPPLEDLLDGHILVFYVTWNEAETDRSLAFELCDAKLSTDAEVRLLLEEDFLFEYVKDFSPRILKPSVDDYGRTIEWMGNVRILLTNAATPRNLDWMEGLPMIFPTLVPLERLVEGRALPARWRACTDRDWVANLKRVLSKSANLIKMQLSLTAFLLVLLTAINLSHGAVVVERHPPAPVVVAPGACDAPGPSGTLTYPPGGTKFDYKKHGSLHLSYSQVSTSTAQTLAIDVVLKAIDIHHSDTHLVSGLSVNSKTAPITAWLWLPLPGDPTLSLCVPYKLQITEWQLHNGKVISFVAASPTIAINC
ncbi:hypothetical protein RQP46_008114 [Phenoliferia psychrophenolica]